jgi:hypothetical protein
MHSSSRRLVSVHYACALCLFTGHHAGHHDGVAELYTHIHPLVHSAACYVLSLCMHSSQATALQLHCCQLVLSAWPWRHYATLPVCTCMGTFDAHPAASQHSIRSACCAKEALCIPWGHQPHLSHTVPARQAEVLVSLSVLVLCLRRRRSYYLFHRSVLLFSALILLASFLLISSTRGLPYLDC